MENLNELEIIETVLNKMRIGLNQDGGDLVLKNWANGTVELDLVLSENACLHCIVDSRMMIANLEHRLKKVLSNVNRVVINDPRNK